MPLSEKTFGKRYKSPGLMTTMQKAGCASLSRPTPLWFFIPAAALNGQAGFAEEGGEASA
jgi:hypothetical protein